MKKKQILYAALLAYSYSSLIGSSLFLGDLTTPDNNNNGFSFDLLPKLGKNRSQEIIYVGSAVDLTNSTADVKKFAVAATSASGTGCIGIAQEKATINGTPNQPNPLYGAQLSTLCMAGIKPVVITQADNSKLYMITSAPTSSICAMVSSNMVKAADGTDGLFATTIPQDTMCGVDPLVFATIVAQDPNQGGIGVFKTTASGLIQQAAVKDDANIKAVLVSKNSEVFKFNSNLANLDRDKINLYWSDKLFRLFVGVQAQNGVEDQDGCRSVGVGYLQMNGEDTALTLYPIAPDSAIEGIGETKIIAAQGQNFTAFVYKQTVMFTSTGLAYLIIVGDSLDPQNNDDLQKHCFALPLVDESVDPSKAATWKTSTSHATLAKKGTLPTTFYKTNRNNLPVIMGRGFQSPAVLLADLYDRTDAPVVVGGSDVDIPGLETGIIQDIEVYNDTVFILLNGAVNGAEHNEPAGIFYSQAIFDENGVIANWTTWQRASCAQNIAIGSIKDFMYIPPQGSVFQLQTGNDNHPRNITLNRWSTGSKDGFLGGTLTDDTVGFTHLITTEFPQANGGVFGLFNFSPTFAEHFFSQTPNVSMMIATGYKKVGLIFNTMDDVRVTGDFQNRTLHFENGAIDPEIVAFTNVAAFISGGVLDELEAITCSTIITHIHPNDLRYIIVGGTGGVALLRRTDNHEGFNSKLDSGFNGFGANLAFETLGNFTNVKKLWTSAINEDQWLFILTLDGLYRISVNDLSTAVPTITTLATLDTVTGLNLSLHDSFTDVVVSDKLCLLGTNKGLLRNGNGSNICTATDAPACNWTPLNVLTPYQHIAQIVPLLTSPLPYEFATQSEGQVYILAHSNTLTTSVIHSFSIKDISSNAIDDTTCKPIYKETIQGTYAPFMSLGSLRNSLATNGALTITTSPAQSTQGAQMFTTPVNLLSFIRIAENYPFSEIQLSLSKTDETIRGTVYNTALGSWIAYGDFGIRVCE